MKRGRLAAAAMALVSLGIGNGQQTAAPVEAGAPAAQAPTGHQRAQESPAVPAQAVQTIQVAPYTAFLGYMRQHARRYEPVWIGRKRPDNHAKRVAVAAARQKVRP